MKRIFTTIKENVIGIQFYSLVMVSLKMSNLT